MAIFKFYNLVPMLALIISTSIFANECIDGCNNSLFNDANDCLDALANDLAIDVTLAQARYGACGINARITHANCSWDCLNTTSSIDEVFDFTSPTDGMCISGQNNFDINMTLGSTNTSNRVEFYAINENSNDILLIGEDNSAIDGFSFEVNPNIFPLNGLWGITALAYGGIAGFPNEPDGNSDATYLFLNECSANKVSVTTVPNTLLVILSVCLIIISTVYIRRRI